MLVDNNDCVWVVCYWEKAGVPRGNPPDRLDVHMTISLFVYYRKGVATI